MPTLEIQTQPPEFNRFRYSKEKSNNVLQDDRKYPTVRLNNFSGEAVIRVDLCERDENGIFSPHTACCLDDKSIREVKVSYPLYTAEFNSLRIKIKERKKGENEGKCGKNEEKQQKGVSKHVAYLIFEAFYERRQAEPLCRAVYSRGIKDGGHISTNSLSITRILPSFGYSASEIVLLTTKVKKDDIEVEFKYHRGDFKKTQMPGYVHHQTAVVVQVPDELQDVIIASFQDRLDVDIRLYRPSTETWSEPKTFTVFKSPCQSQPDTLVPFSDMQSHPAAPQNLASTSAQSHASAQNQPSAQNQTSQEHLLAVVQPHVQAQYMPSPHPLASSQYAAPPPYSSDEPPQSFFQVPFQTANQQAQLAPHLGGSMSLGISPNWVPTQQGSSTMTWPTTPTTLAQHQDVNDLNFLEFLMDHDGDKAIQPRDREDMVYRCSEHTHNTRSRQREVKKKLAPQMDEMTSVLCKMSIGDYEERILHLRKQFAQSLNEKTMREVARSMHMHCDEEISALGPLLHYMQKEGKTLGDLRNHLAILAAHLECEKSVLILDMLIDLLRQRRRQLQQTEKPRLANRRKR